MFTFIFLAALFVRDSESHGFLKSPRSRNFIANQNGVWWGGTSSTYKKETCPHCLNRGGTLGQCGVWDGRSYDANLNFLGQPMSPVPQARFVQGQEIEVEAVLTAHHKGHFEFFACPIASGGVATEACFKQYPLTFVSDPLYGAPADSRYPTRAYIAPPERTTTDNSIGLPGNFYRFRYKLPSNLSGDLVLLQWRYYTANSCKYAGYSSYPFPSSWGNMQDNLGVCGNIPPDGNGFPEQFWNCAEISISRSGVAPSPSPPNPLPTGSGTGTCGGGSRGNGACRDSSLCCSQWGHCGTGKEYCGTTSTTGTCGNGSRGNGACRESGLCCSQWGYCGTGSAYCGTTRQGHSTSISNPPFSTPTDSSYTTMDSIDPPIESHIMPGASLVMPPVETPIAPIAPTQKPKLSTSLNVVEYQIKSRWAGEYLTLSDNTNGANITLEHWNAQLPSQRWYRESADDLDFPNYRWLRCKLDDYYLAVTEGENDAHVVGWNIDPEKIGLTWTLKKVKGNIYHIINSWNGMCLSATPSAEGYGDVVVKDCQSDKIQQQWLLEKVID